MGQRRRLGVWTLWLLALMAAHVTWNAAASGCSHLAARPGLDERSPPLREDAGRRHQHDWRRLRGVPHAPATVEGDGGGARKQRAQAASPFSLKPACGIVCVTWRINAQGLGRVAGIPLVYPRASSRLAALFCLAVFLLAFRRSPRVRTPPHVSSHAFVRSCACAVLLRCGCLFCACLSLSSERFFGFRDVSASGCAVSNLPANLFSEPQLQ